MRPGTALRLTTGAIIVAGLVLPVAFGLGHSLRAAFGHFPAIGAQGPDLEAWRALMRMPGLTRAAMLSLTTGFVATILSLILSLALLAAVQGRMPALRLGRVMTPVLAAPHAAMAIGLAFVLAPSGWIARALAPVMGWALPPDIANVGDPWGIGLTLGLIVKEVPFLTLILLSALGQVPVRAHLATGRALGYGRAACWLWLLVPQLWPLIRLPVLVVLAFSISVVDMALILGPSNPPTLSVMVARMFADPDLRAILRASAGGVLQLGLVGAGFALLLLAEWVCRVVGRLLRRRGARGRWLDGALWLPALAGAALMVLAGLALISLAVWSVSFSWRWPDLWPSALSLRAWGATGGWMRAAGQALVIAGVSTGVALVLAVAWLESGDRVGRRGAGGWLRAAIHVPLLLPQLSFLIGLAGLMLHLNVNAPLVAVIWGHWLFVFPYVMIALADPWAALDPRLDRTAAALGASRWRRLVRVKLPVLVAPICTAAAVGFAVSIAQYLPTLFLGGGRIVTLTTEAVALSSGSDRRVAAVHATLQALLPLMVFLLALALPAILHRNRSALRGEHA